MGKENKMNRLNAFRHVDSRSLPILKDGLWEWINVIERLANKWNWEDVPWGYTERPLLSTFAGAIWNSGGIAFEEYSTQKTYKLRRTSPKKKSYTGRCDLYFEIEGKTFIVEAKHVWSAAGEKSTNTVSKIREAMIAASKAVKKIKSEDEERIAMVFATPYIPTSQEARIDEQIKNWIAKINKIKHSSIAWIFPPKARTPLQKERWFYPGVALLIKKPS